MWNQLNFSKKFVYCGRRQITQLKYVRSLMTLCQQANSSPKHNYTSRDLQRPESSSQSWKKLHPAFHSLRRFRHRGSGKDTISHLFAPVPIKARSDEINVGAEMAGPLKKGEILRILNKFFSNDDVRELANEHGLDEYLYQQAYISFRKFCLESETLPVELHIVIKDVLQEAAHVHDIYPSFRKHALKTFPHLNCMDDLYKISDLSTPPNWYSEARAVNRKIIFHAGPTNSGKTYHAMEQFLCADSGIYCGPLKLLATEVFKKSNDKGTPCDLVTGEERKSGYTDGSSASHVACTVEMSSLDVLYDVAIIDEIQMVRDPQRGWAWTRALLGICAREVHVCGEECAIELVKELVMAAGEEVEVRRYKRLTPLSVENSGLETLDNVHPGDCIVCFSKRDIHYVSKEIEKRGHEVAVIYGGLPPGTKLVQAYKFNDPNHPCKVLVATDAIGMGLNLSIRRVIFYSLIKPKINESGEKEMETLSVSAALQIAGRAGRYGTKWEHGYVTCMKSEDLPTLRRLLSSTPDDISQAGLHPTADQIELFAYHLPTYTLSNLMDIFVRICTVDSSLYFMCLFDEFKFLADLIQHIPLQLRARYVFCCAPISKKMPFVCAMFLKFVRQFSQSQPATVDWVCHHLKWPFSAPINLLELVHLEEVFDVFDLYLWLSYRFQDMFPDADLIRDLQHELDGLIQEGVSNITALINRSKPSMVDMEDIFIMDQKKKNYGKRGTAVSQSKMSKNSMEKGSIGRGRLTDSLIAQGLLSPKMLEELKNEWQAQGEHSDKKWPTSPIKPRKKRR